MSFTGCVFSPVIFGGKICTDFLRVGFSKVGGFQKKKYLPVSLETYL